MMENTVNVCPVCGYKGASEFCQDCGFCFSSDYEHYPTLVMIPDGVKSVQQLRTERESRHATTTCKCCGQVFSGASCPYCGFTAVLRSVAEKHRQQILEQVTDISIQYYQYRWNSQREKFDNLSSKEERLASGQECYENIVWSGMRFAQLPLDGKCTVGVEITCKGVKKRKYCNLPVVHCDSFWRVGIKIDSSLRLHVFLGNEKQHTSAEPIMLQLN